ncbi:MULTISPECIES: Gfo/Idh/MocA family protein [unclassified Pseudactinotalea]|uniref:Gfo/Idh/MocA family protein n=1 Tax=Micrococcales TaxID=85006 RepID=UPI003C798294
MSDAATGTGSPGSTGSPGTGPLGVACIGYAFMGKAHSAAWREVSAHFDVPATSRQVLVGRDAGQVAEAAATYGWAESATDWRDVIARDDIDIVDICTPGETHAEIALAALAAGKHVMVEKPLANTLTEAEAMAAAATEATGRGAFSMVGFNYRRVPALAHARNLIAQGVIGQVRQIRGAYLQDWLADAQAPMTWRLRAETAGSGALGDIASHTVDLVGFLTGSTATDVSARLQTFVPQRPGPAGPEDVTVDDGAWLTLGLSGGAVAERAVAGVEVSRVALGRKNALTLEIYGTEGAICFDLERLNELQVLRGTDAASHGFARVLITEEDHPYLSAWWPPGHVIGWQHTFVHQVRDFLSALDSGTPPTPSFADGLATQRVLAAAQESARNASATITLGSA